MAADAGGAASKEVPVVRGLFAACQYSSARMITIDKLTA
jgi:hypothetical protein